MSNYTKTVDFAAKDTLPSGDSGKIIKGTEFETEFDNISTAIATKADSAAPTFTGTSVFTNLDINGTVQADGAVTVGVDDTGYDVKFFGATAGKSLLWDESADSLIVTGTTTLVGTTNLDAVDVDGDMTFGDDNKAIFGAGSDLQIYRDGTSGHSYIKEAGTGNLNILANDLRIRNAAGNEDMIQVNQDGDVKISYDGSTKLATTATGIDVTGSVTAVGLTVDGLAAISSTTPELRMFETDTTDLNTQLRSGVGKFEIKTLNDAVTLATKRFELDHATGDISFYNDAAAQALFWDSSASALGLGTTSPNNRIDAVEAQGTVANVLANGTYVAKFTGNTTYTTGASQGILIGGVDGSLRGVALVAEAQSALNDHNFIIAVSGTSATPTERMRIDSGGNAGIGTSVMGARLNVETAASAGISYPLDISSP